MQRRSGPKPPLSVHRSVVGPVHASFHSPLAPRLHGGKHASHRYHRATVCPSPGPVHPLLQTARVRAARSRHQKTAVSTHDIAWRVPPRAHAASRSPRDCYRRLTARSPDSVCPNRFSLRSSQFPEYSPHRAPSLSFVPGWPPPRISFVPRLLLFLSSTCAETQTPQAGRPLQPSALRREPSPVVSVPRQYCQPATDREFVARLHSVFLLNQGSCICRP